MIREIRISKLALIDELVAEFDKGFTVVTGETGAGKSILIGAIGLLLGERASADQIRSGSDTAEVCGVFDISDSNRAIKSLLDEMEIDPADGTLIIRRKISRSDRNRILVNQTPLPLASLKRLGDLLVDLHGQHEHQSLLSEDTHLSIVDDLPEVGEVRERYRESYLAFQAAQTELEAFEARAAALAERREVLEFQYKELGELKLQVGEEEALENELKLLSTGAERTAAASEIVDLLASSADSVEKRIAAIKRKIEILTRYDAAVKPWIDDVENALSILTELETFCTSYLETAGDADPSRIDFLNSRLAKIQRLRKKYGCTHAGLIAKCESLAADLASLENIEADRDLFAKRASSALAACRKAGEALGAARRSACRSFDKKITGHMERLGFTGGRWETVFAKHDLPQATGLERASFHVQTNPGEPLMPLAATASGGEISRLMLAVKTVMANHDRIPVLIFDEIDTGIGGVLAGSVAKALVDLAASHQVLCISHLHQIASLADSHFHVFKETKDGRTVTHIACLNDKERMDEIARMLGGDSAAARAHAKELLGKRVKL